MNEEGQGLIEYALVICIISIAIIVAMIFLRAELQGALSGGYR